MNEISKELQQRLTSFIKNNTPIQANGKSLYIENLNFTVPKELDDYNAQLIMKYSKDSDLRGYLLGDITIKDDKTGKVLKQYKNRKICPFYYATERNTYIINGVERTLMNKMKRRPGVYTKYTSNGVDAGVFFANHKEQNLEYVPGMNFSFNPAKQLFKVKIGKGSGAQIDGVAFLKALGFTESEIIKAMGNNEIADNVYKKSKGNVTISALYQQIVGKPSPFSKETDTKDALFSFLNTNASFGDDNNTLKATLGVNTKSFDKNAILATVQKVFAAARSENAIDDTEDIRFKTISSPNDQIVDKFAADFKLFEDKVKKDLESPQNNVLLSLNGLSDTKNSSITKLMKGEMSDTATQNSPLTVAGYATQITQIADGLSENQIMRPQRNLKKMSMNRIDPIDTPESLKAGSIEHLSENVKVKNGTALISVLKVTGGIAEDTAKNTVEIDPVKEYDSKIAFHDLNYVKKTGNKISFKTKDGTVPGRYKGQKVNLRVAEIQYVDKAPQTVFGDFANMIPFVTHDDGNRVTFGSKYQRQSMILKNRELPMVSMVSSDGKTTYEEKLGKELGKPIYSEVAGTVTSIKDGKITVTDAKNKAHVYQYYNYYMLNEGYINNDLKVKVGDKVKKGQMLAEGWQTKDGKLATGVNAKVAFMAYKGLNYEDGLVVSESFAKKMAVEDVQTIEFEVKKEWLGGRGSGVQKEFAAYTNDQSVFTKLDKDGIIKEGEKVKSGDILCAYLRPAKEDDSIISLFQDPSKKKKKYLPGYCKIPSGSYVAGEVKRVLFVPGTGTNKQKIIFTIVQTKYLKQGDKLAGKHGNKGTISKVVPDIEMPTREDGERLDVLYSSLAVPSRKNTGQLFEANAGLVAEKTGKNIVMNNFDPNNVKKLRQDLKKIGYADGKMRVTLHERSKDGKIHAIKVDNPVTVGDMYMMKLVHKVDEKIQSRVGDESSAVLNRQTNMPGKNTGSKEGERHNPMSLDSMATDALQGHQAVWNILECTTIKADGGGDSAQRAAMFNAIKTGKLDGLDQYSAVPETVNVMAKKLKALGMNVTPLNDGKKVKDFSKSFDSIRISPMKPSEMLKEIGAKNEVTSRKILDPKANGVNARAKDGLADERIFGDLNDPSSKNKWGYINLVTPIANPVYAGLNTQGNDANDIYSLLTGIKHKDIKAMSEGKLVMIADPEKYTGAAFKGLTKKEIQFERKRLKANMEKAGLKPGQLIDPERLNKLIQQHGEIVWKSGNEGLLQKLDSVDIGASMRETQKALKAAKKPNDINFNYQKLKALQMLKTNKMEASDLMLKYVPVTPLYLRDPGIAMGETVYKIDANTHYQNIISHNEAMKKTVENGTDMFAYRNPTEAAKETGKLYGYVANLSGHMNAVDFKTKKPLKGVSSELAGDTGLIFSKMMKKRQDFSARSVIGVDPNLGLDEVGVPIDIAKNVMKLEIIRDLVKTGKARDEIEAEQKWSKLDSDTVASIKKLAKNDPMIINRAPSLHKFSVQAFKPVIKDNSDGVIRRNIELNPLVVTGFNADFDGDQMSLFMPITDRAKKEALDKLLPSQNLVSETSGKMIPSIRHEMALGIYYLTMSYDKGVGKTPTAYPSVERLRADYMNGKIKPNKLVKVTVPGSGSVSATAGSILVNSLMPAKFRNFSKAWKQDDINKMIRTMYDEMEETNGKAFSRRDVVDCLEKFKTLGFEAATRSGISLGINDFGDEKKIEKKYSLDKLDKLEGEKRIKAWSEVEGKIESDLKSGALLKKTNPAQIMLTSGARGSASQYRRMLGTVGLGKDITGKTVTPIAKSHMQGLSPQDYFVHGFDARKGLYDRSVSTRDPGTVFKYMSSAMQNVVVKEKDCGTTDGIMMKKWHTSLVGRVAAEDVFSKGGKSKIVKKGQVITQRIRDKIVKDSEVEEIKVRSPLRCKTPNGVCAKCYGYIPGQHKFPSLGTPVGSLAAQAVGEPIQQATMNTFHTGGTASSSQKALDHIEKVLGASVISGTEGAIAERSGKITAIKKGTPGTADIVYIDGKPVRIPHYKDGSSRKLRVAVGDYVTKGDFLTVGNISDIYSNQEGFTMVKPTTLLKTLSSGGQKDALNKTKDYMASSLDQALTLSLGGSQVGKQGKVDRRHMELITKNMTGYGKVTSMNVGGYTKGQTVDTNEVDAWNKQNAGFINATDESINNAAKIIGKMAAATYKSKQGAAIVQKGEMINSTIWTKLQATGIKKVKVCNAPVTYTPEINSLKNTRTINEKSWVSNLSANKEDNFKTQVAKASLMGTTDPLSDNRGRRMTGKLLRIGEGFKVPRKVGDSFSSKLSNFFHKKK